MSELRNCVVTMTHYNRPEYTRRALEALSRCDGIADCLLVAHVEPGTAEVIDQLKAINFCETAIVCNNQRQGVARNTLRALEHGLELSDFVVHVEDDILMAEDALTYFWWARATYHNDARVGSVSAYRRTAESIHPVLYNDVRRLRWFHPWGLGIWRDRYQAARPHVLHICGLADDPAGGFRVVGPGVRNTTTPYGDMVGGWDGAFGSYAGINGLVQPYPLLSRVQNIGAISSTHGASFTPEFHATQQHCPQWAGDGRHVARRPWRDVEDA